MEKRRVDIWTVSLDEARSVLLSPEEQERATRFRFERDRVRWSRARSALRSILSDVVQVTPLEIQFRIGEHGKPSIKDRPETQFSLSHSRGWAMIAVSRGVPVGVDLEAVRDDVAIDRLLKRIGEPHRPAPLAELFQRWTRREARTKALGIPLMEAPFGRVIAIDVIAPAGFAASVALDGFEPVPVYQAS